MFSIRLFGIAALAAGLAVPAAAFAQQAPPAPGVAQPGMHHHHNKFRSALRGVNLSAGQKTQIDQIYAQARGQNKNADQATRKANRARVRQQVEGVLTQAQRDQLHAAMRQERGRH